MFVCLSLVGGRGRSNFCDVNWARRYLTLTGIIIIKGQLSDVNNSCVTGQILRLLPRFDSETKESLAVTIRPVSYLVSRGADFEK